ncbi:MAG: hypothetical protein ACOYYJ_11055, partial [Chloroflexota bacterium]
MANTNPVEQLKSEYAALQSQVKGLQDKARLSSARDALEDMQTTVRGLDQKIKDLRTRGYVFGKDIEAQASNYEQQ